MSRLALGALLALASPIASEVALPHVKARSAAPGQAASGPPNVIVIDICSARADHFGLYGYSKPTTPRLDALARETAVFDKAMAQSSWCLPNYATLFTGHAPESHGLYTNVPFRSLPRSHKTLAEKMKGAGYKTAAFSGGVYMLPAWGLDRGFDTFSNLFSTQAATPAALAETLPRMRGWLEQNKKSPFFLYAAVDDLHAPYQSEDPDVFDPGYSGVVHDTDVAHVRFFRAYNGEPLQAHDPLLAKLRAFREDPRALAHLTAHYDAALRQTDRDIARLVAYLKDSGLWEKSVVIITADHGEMLGEQGLLGHTQGLYEPILRVPLLIHHPAYPEGAGRRIKEPVQRIDLTPTILDSAGVSHEEMELQGRSLLPLLGAGPWRREYAFASSKRNAAQASNVLLDERAVTDGRWKLHWYSYKEGFELYDLDRDPLEKKNLVRLRPEIAHRLAFELMKRSEADRPHAPGLPSGQTPPTSLEPSRLD